MVSRLGGDGMLCVEGTVAEVMSRTVITARETDRVAELWHRFDEHGVSGAPVIDQDRRLLGVVSKTDMLRALLDAPSNGSVVDGSDLRVEAIMTCCPIALCADASIARASALLAYEGVHRIVIIDEHGRLAGIVTALDIARWVAQSSGFVVPASTQRQLARDAPHA